MASSEQKRHTQNLKRYSRNQAAKSRLKTLIKKVETAAASGDAAGAETQLKLAISVIQRAGRKKILPPNTAARRVSKLSRLVYKHKSMATR